MPLQTGIGSGPDKDDALLSQYGDQIELVLANNDDMALGAVVP